jgi:hypothetical protein
VQLVEHIKQAIQSTSANCTQEPFLAVGSTLAMGTLTMDSLAMGTLAKGITKGILVKRTAIGISFAINRANPMISNSDCLCAFRKCYLLI